MSQSALTCRELIDFIGEYLEDELPSSDRQRFEEHLALCPDCVTYLDGYRKTSLLQSHAFDPSDPVPGAVPEALVSAILEVRRRARTP